MKNLIFLLLFLCGVVCYSQEAKYVKIFKLITEETFKRDTLIIPEGKYWVITTMSPLSLIHVGKMTVIKTIQGEVSITVGEDLIYSTTPIMLYGKQEIIYTCLPGGEIEVYEFEDPNN